MKKKLYPGIQILRGVLFLLILAFHCDVPYASLGWGGVETFFVLSSFFIVKAHYGDNNFSVKREFIKRIIRLYPPYICTIIAAALYALLSNRVPYDIMSHLLSIQNFQWMMTAYSSPMQPLTAHTWTLSIEVWNGLIWLLLLKFVPKSRFKHAMWITLVIGIIYRFVTISMGFGVYVVALCPLAHLDAFSLGSILALFVKENTIKASKKFLNVAGVIGAVGTISCIAIIAFYGATDFWGAYKLLSSSANYLNNCFTGNLYFYIALESCFTIGKLLFYDSREYIAIETFEKQFVELGNKSYLLYLFHWPVLMIFKRFISVWYVLFAVVLAATLAVSIIFNKFLTNMTRILGRCANDTAV